MRNALTKAMAIDQKDPTIDRATSERGSTSGGMARKSMVMPRAILPHSRVIRGPLQGNVPPGGKIGSPFLGMPSIRNPLTRGLMRNKNTSYALRLILDTGAIRPDHRFG